MSAAVLQNILWFAGPLVQVAIIVMMMKRDLRGSFPFFFSYNVFQLLSNFLSFAIFRYAHEQYFFFYWTYVAVSTLIGLAVIHEVFNFAIRPYVGLRELGNVIFRWAALLLILVCTIAAASSNGTHSARLTVGMVNLERSARLLQVGLLLFLGLCSSQLGLTWRNFACGIALGFGTFSATDLIVSSIGPSAKYTVLVGTISGLAYLAAQLLWFGYATQPQQKRVTNNEYQPAFDRWNQAAMLVLGPQQPVNAEHTYLSDIEKTVEAVLAQRA